MISRLRDTGRLDDTSCGACLLLREGGFSLLGFCSLGLGASSSCSAPSSSEGSPFFFRRPDWESLAWALASVPNEIFEASTEAPCSSSSSSSDELFPSWLLVRHVYMNEEAHIDLQSHRNSRCPN